MNSKISIFAREISCHCQRSDSRLGPFSAEFRQTSWTIFCRVQTAVVDHFLQSSDSRLGPISAEFCQPSWTIFFLQSSVSRLGPFSAEFSQSASPYFPQSSDSRLALLVSLLFCAGSSQLRLPKSRKSSLATTAWSRVSPGGYLNPKS